MIYFMGGKVFRVFRRKEFLLGKWSSFEISQATENYKNKKRLMFKVVIDGKVLLQAEQPQPFEKPVKVFASSSSYRQPPALPAVIKNLRIDLLGGKEEYKCQEEGVVYMYRRFRNAPAGFKHGKTDTWEECQKSCEAIDQCKGFTWHKENNRYSKACSLFSTHSGKISGKKTV